MPTNNEISDRRLPLSNETANKLVNISDTLGKVEKSAKDRFKMAEGIEITLEKIDKYELEIIPNLYEISEISKKRLEALVAHAIVQSENDALEKAVEILYEQSKEEIIKKVNAL